MLVIEIKWKVKIIKKWNKIKKKLIYLWNTGREIASVFNIGMSGTYQLYCNDGIHREFSSSANWWHSRYNSSTFVLYGLGHCDLWMDVVELQWPFCAPKLIQLQCDLGAASTQQVFSILLLCFCYIARKTNRTNLK